MKYITVTQQNKKKNGGLFKNSPVNTIFTLGVPDSFNGVLNQEGGYQNSPNHEADGWYPYVEPSYDPETQELGQLYFSTDNYTFTNVVNPLSDEEVKTKKEQESNEKQIALAQQVALQTAVDSAQEYDDTQALDNADIYPMWTQPFTYPLDFKCKAFDGNELYLYKVVQAHASQEGWEPPNVPALFVRVAYPGEIPVWVQPTGAHDAYNTGDQVHFPTATDPVYESTIDNNVYSPTDYPQGWQLVP